MDEHCRKALQHLAGNAAGTFSNGSCRIKNGDMIISVEGRMTESVDDPHRTLSDHEVGNPIDLVILRGQERIVLNVTPVEAAH